MVIPGKLVFDLFVGRELIAEESECLPESLKSLV